MHIYADFMIALLCAVEFEVRVCFSMLVIPSKDKVSVRWCGAFSENTVCVPCQGSSSGLPLGTHWWFGSRSTQCGDLWRNVRGHLLGYSFAFILKTFALLKSQLHLPQNVDCASLEGGIFCCHFQPVIYGERLFSSFFSYVECGQSLKHQK